MLQGLRESFCRLTKYEKAMYAVLIIYALSINFSAAIISICYGFGALIMLVQYYHTKNLPKIDKRIVYIVGIYNLVWLLISFFSVNIENSLHQWGSVAYRFLPMFFAAMYLKRMCQIKYLMMIFCLAIIIGDFISFYQVFFETEEYVENGRRVIGFVDNPNALAMILLLFIPAMFYMFLQFINDGLIRYWFLLGVLCSIASLVLTQTRGAWLSLIVMLIIGTCIDKRYRSLFIKIICTGAVAVMVGLMLSSNFSHRVNTISNVQESSYQDRIMIYESSWEMVKDHPIVGVGLDNFGDEYNYKYINPDSTLGPNNGSYTVHAHNNALMVLTEGGITGFSVTLLLYIMILYLLWEKYKKSGRTDCLALMGIFACLGLHFGGITDQNINAILPMRELWFLMGIAFSCPEDVI